MQIKENIPLIPYTVFKIGGAADYFCEVKNKEELAEALNWAGGKQMPFFVLGTGSNVLFSDEGFRGLVIKINIQNLSLAGSRKLVADSGVSMARAVNFAIDNGLGGFEWGIGIPGTIGGSVFSNAGCFGGEMKDIVESAEVLEMENVAPRKLSGRDCGFSYRNSTFKKNPNLIILGATLKLQPADPKESRAKILEYTKKRASTQDIGSQCAGCIFKNFTPPDGGAVIPAGYLIDTAGLKDKKAGKATVSEKHANYIVNTGGATARDVKELIRVIKNEVERFHGILLEEEIRIV